ncbi:hypothetical protein L1987_52221 [Smallanthus sonchifolius]|uniref:Uncharacterized protein n=1 Tax=Smallanthus sonchifolius TaxID=185202 RepID=A0ACB9ERY6_9ASTR|nr:hypothetical protein L1987_52221 [Smallanthus sonchifolius]
MVSVSRGTKLSQNETGSEKATSELNVGGGLPKDLTVIQSSAIRQLEIDGVQIRDNSESSNGMSEEIGDTIEVGGTMGVNLEGFENQLIEEINDEGAHVGYQ